MSGIHCNFEKLGGSWFITDTSTNGVFFNGADERLTRNEAVPLNSGDHIRLGDYELEVAVDVDDFLVTCQVHYRVGAVQLCTH